MAIKQIGGNYDFDVKEYIVDSAQDLTSLPINIGWGSTALCIDNGLIYILASNKEWKSLGSDTE